MKTKRPGVNIAKVGLGLVYLMMPDGFTGIGEYLYAVDPSTMRVLHGVSFEKVLGVFGRFEEKEPVGSDGVQVGLCPRTLLSNILQSVSTCDLTCLPIAKCQLQRRKDLIFSRISRWF